MEESGARAAALFAQLPDQTFTHQESQTFQGVLDQYAEVRNAILPLWHRNPSSHLFFQDIQAQLPGKANPHFQARVYSFLNNNGYINFGLPRGLGPDSVLPAAKPPPVEQVTPALVTEHAHSAILAMDMEKDTENTVRKRVEGMLGLPAGSVKGNPGFKAAVKGAISEHLELNGTKPPAWCCAAKLHGSHRKYIVVGAGPSGLSAALHLQRRGASVVVLEARDRCGGRVHTVHDTLSAPVDYGAQLCTGLTPDLQRGVGPDPSACICAQLGIKTADLTESAPLFDGESGAELNKELDERAFQFFNAMLDSTMASVHAAGQQSCARGDSLGAALMRELDVAMRAHRARVCAADRADADAAPAVEDGAAAQEDASSKGAANTALLELLQPGDEAEDSAFRRAVFWHWQNLEYGCSADLDWVSLQHWNQDERFGAYGGAHGMVLGGYGQLTDALAAQLRDVRYNCPVRRVAYGPTGVRVHCCDGTEVAGDAVLVSVPIGVLKAGGIEFEPALPQWKTDAIQHIEMGKLNKIFLEFSEPFWGDAMDPDTQQFGITLEEACSKRGMAATIWNFRPFTDVPILCALATGSAAVHMEALTDAQTVDAATAALRAVFKEKLPPVVRSAVVRWGEDPFARGSYSYVGVNGSGDDYDMLARPVGRTLLFCGEHTSKDHLDTVGGALRTGMREASRLLVFAQAVRGDSEACRLADLAQDEAFQDSSEQAVPGMASEARSKAARCKKGQMRRNGRNSSAGRKAAAASRRTAAPATLDGTGGGSGSEGAGGSPRGRKRSPPGAKDGGAAKEAPGGKRARANCKSDDMLDAEGKRIRQGAKAMKPLLQALAAAAAGNTARLAECLRSCSVADMSQQAFCVRTAVAEQRDAVSRCPACLSVLANWIKVLSPPSRTPILIDVLEMLLALSIDATTTTVAPDLGSALTSASSHSSKDVKAAAGRVLTRVNAATSALATEAAARSPRAASKGPSKAATALNKGGPRSGRPESKAGKAESKPGRAEAKSNNTEMRPVKIEGKADAAGVRAAGRGTQLPIDHLEPIDPRKLLLYNKDGFVTGVNEELVARVPGVNEQMAAALRLEVDRLKEDCREFLEESRRSDEVLAEQRAQLAAELGTPKASARAARPSGGVLKRPRPYGSASAPASKVPATAAAAAARPEGQDTKALRREKEFAKDVVEHVKRCLADSYRKKLLSKEAFKTIAHRASDKVIAHTLVPSTRPLLTDTTKRKIEKLVNEYVAKQLARGEAS